MGTMFEGFSAVPLSKWRLSWLPVCTERQYKLCYKAELPCRFASSKLSNKECQRIKMVLNAGEVEESE